MEIQRPHGHEAKDTVFINVENGGGALFRGDLVVWDLTDNRVTALQKDTFGIRGLRHDGTNPGAGLHENSTFCGVAEQDADAIPSADVFPPIGAPGASDHRGPMFLVQVYGYHDAAKYGGNNVLPGAGCIVPSESPGFPGSMSCFATSVMNANPGRFASVVGFNYVDSGATFALKPMFVRCL